MALSSEIDLEKAWRQLGVIMNGDTSTVGTFNGLLGRDFNGAWLDEWHGLKLKSKPQFYAEFRDPNFPDADVTVVERGRDKRDPLNPNPKAGTTKTWVVIAGGRESGAIGNSVIAVSKAKALHAKLLKAENAKRASSMPTWGMF